MEHKQICDLTPTEYEQYCCEFLAGYAEKEKLFPEGALREIERIVLLRNVDKHWIDHIDAMDDLEDGIGLRAYGQHNPVVEYRNEGTDMFNAMIDSVRRETSKKMLLVEYKTSEEVKREKVAEESATSDDGSLDKTVRGKGVVSKNALCPCGSGKKYKRCCGKDED